MLDISKLKRKIIELRIGIKLSPPLKQLGLNFLAQKKNSVSVCLFSVKLWRVIYVRLVVL